ncbi:hypothetical protein PHYPSEUDO_007762 [Phytophthora pseudosyringae]|uniref:Uncharacterized protein n=1 Tax=Phytophthora pseudosyringae TaxID=221518 RepID=A0A8T1VIW1_9STRA|nr:hypothetical protein PHYPSEUDO_007762 [Phytophthora pseudosyringae]
MSLLEADSGKSILASDSLEGYADAANTLPGRTIPFLAPPNAEWPQYIRDTNREGCKFGHLVRVSDRERSDVYVQDLDNTNEKAMLVCDCKYWNKSVDADVMGDILGGLDATWLGWSVVLVFCKEFAGLGAPRKEQKRIGCVKLKFQGVNADTKWVFQPAVGDRDKLLIVVEIGTVSG